MNKSLRSKARILALTAAITASGSFEATGGAEAANIPGKAQAMQEAAYITHIINEPQHIGPLKVATVPGILHGLVEIRFADFPFPTFYRNPIVLWQSHSTAQIDTNHRLIDGSWIGIPIQHLNSAIATSIEVEQIELGRIREPKPNSNLFETVKLISSAGGELILNNYGVEDPPYNSSTFASLEAVNLLNPNAPDIPIIAR